MSIVNTINRADLPVPDSVALAHSQRLCHRIRQTIHLNGGNISFARYMEMALYEPGLGYYSGGACKFGSAGDFVTAPEISILFTQCLARQCSQIITQLPQPSILELGPGSGRMARDLLLELDQNNVLPEKYFMLELSADLRHKQQQQIHDNIPHLEHRVIWLDRLPQKPFSGLVLGNEVLDAMPVHRLIKQNNIFHELCVRNTEDGFSWETVSLTHQLQQLVEKQLGELYGNLPDGYITEINLQINPWLNSLADLLTQGVMLFIDYGYPCHEYYHPQRTEGTLLCHYRHHVHDDPFLYPGLQDITASVDFTTVAEAADCAGLRTSGFITQAHFLMNNGLEELLNRNQLTSAIEHAELGRQARLLTMPGEMGERFKVIALTKDFSIPLAGFQTFDQRSRL
jgi:SAM-dependent MidA family methyltransferase